MYQNFRKAWLPTLILSCAVYTNAHATAYHSSDVEAFKHTWTAQVLKLQREIDIDTPLNEATFIGTHNSYNSKSYQIPFVRYVDPNHILSLYDQLEMGVRSIELDAHWTLTSNFTRDILLCHGLSSHWGCGAFDRQFTEGLEEVRDWLKANPHEVILLYIERHLDGHEPRLASELNQYLGEFIFKPSGIRTGNDPDACVAFPASALTKAAILKTGKQLVVVAKGCDGSHPNYEEQDKFPEHWNDFVFAGIGTVNNSPFDFIDSGIDDYTPFPDCGKSKIFYPDPNHTGIWRIFEDRTMLSGILNPDSKDILRAKDMRELVRCGINWPTMDMLSVTDDRLPAAIWSWADSYPQEGQGQCVMYKNNEGMQNLSCGQPVAGYACQNENTHDVKAISTVGKWANGEAMCQTMSGKEWHFAVPVNGFQMDKLKQSMQTTSVQEVWLNYAENTKGDWIANQRG